MCEAAFVFIVANIWSNVLFLASKLLNVVSDF